MSSKSALFFSIFSISLVLALIGFTFCPKIHGHQIFKQTTQRSFGGPGSLSFYHDLDQPVVLADQPNRVVLRVGATAPIAPSSWERLPLN
ncbi:MAG: hypothetical protein K8I00_07100, partial [Candidatus Omnitrophica bacterium]|nr:hypothetical protein [Candidatus Omnitrophota bacterium]